MLTVLSCSEDSSLKPVGVRMARLEKSDLASKIRSCKRCSARKDARCPVPGDGPEDAVIIFIGRNPGKNEDEKNRPFIGRAGKLLNEILDLLELDRTRCAVLNTVKCYTAGNRAPTKEEISFCLPWLKKELKFFFEKRILIPLGSEAFKAFFPNSDLNISRAVGRSFKPDGSKIATIPLFHPAYLLRNASEKTKMFNYTLPKVRNYLKENFAEIFSV